MSLDEFHFDEAFESAVHTAIDLGIGQGNDPERKIRFITAMAYLRKWLRCGMFVKS